MSEKSWFDWLPGPERATGLRRTRRGDIVFGRSGGWGCWPSTGSSATIPVSGEKITKLGGGVGDAKTPFTERPATYASKSPGPSASKMVPSIIGEDLTIRGNITCKGEVQVDGEIVGDIRCGSLLLGDKSQVRGGVAAEDVVVRGHLAGTITGVRITLQAQCHVEGDIVHQSLAIEQGAYFEGKSRRSDNPLAEIKVPDANDSANLGSQSASSPTGDHTLGERGLVAAE